MPISGSVWHTTVVVLAAVKKSFMCAFKKKMVVGRLDKDDRDISESFPKELNVLKMKFACCLCCK